MKKILLTTLSLLMFTGCVSEGKTTINNKDEVVYELNDRTLTKGEIYNLMLAQNGYMAILEEAQNFILEKEVVLTEEDHKEIEKEFDDIKAMYTEGWEDTLLQIGYKDEIAFKNTIILRKKDEKLLTKFIELKLADYITLYNPRQIQVMTYTDKAVAELALADLKADHDFNDVAEENNSTGNSEKYVYTNQAKLSFDVKSFIDKSSSNTLSEILEETIPATEEGKEATVKYHIVKVVDTDTNNFKEDLIDALAAIETIKTEMLVHYLNEYNFTVYNKEVKSIIDSINPDYLG